MGRRIHRAAGLAWQKIVAGLRRTGCWLGRPVKWLMSHTIRFIVRVAAEERARVRQAGQAVYRVPMRLQPIRPGRAIKVAFLVEYPQSWCSLESVWREFKADARCETELIALTEAFYSLPLKTSAATALNEMGLPFFHSDGYELAGRDMDVIFLHSPYDTLRPPEYSFQAVSRHVPRVAYIPYGFEIGAERQTNQYCQPLQAKAWRVFVRSERFRKMYGKHCPAGNGHTVVSGHPMVDAVVSFPRERVSPDLLGFVAGRKCIVWNPHYKETKERSDFSTFLRWKDLLLDIFSARQDCVLILRPHPFLLPWLIQNGLMSLNEVSELRQRIMESGNIWLDEHWDFRSAFSASDGLISDTSSFLLLYGATGKPVQFLPNPTGPGLNEDGEMIELYYQGHSPQAIRDFVAMVAEGKDPLGPERRKRFGDFVFMPEGGAGRQIKEYVVQAVLRGV